MFSKKRMYLDYAAAAPVRKEAARAYARAGLAFGNPSSPHEEGRTAHIILEEARRLIARITEVKPDDVVFTSGATEANAIAILGIPKKGDHVLYLPSAHASVVENMQLLKANGVSVEALPIENQKVSTERLRAKIRRETVLVSMDAVCGETGIIWNTREVAQVLKETAPQARLHVDASQAPLTQKLSRSHFDADILTLDAGKIGGVRGIGCLIAHRTIPISPLYKGGGQERGLRSGTESPSSAAAFAAALAACAEEREIFLQKAEVQRRELLALITRTLPHLHINESKNQDPHILNISIPGCDTDYLVALFDEEGIALSTRSACETNSEEGSRAVFTLWGDVARAKATLRISWGSETSAKSLTEFAKTLPRISTFASQKFQ